MKLKIPDKVNKLSNRPKLQILDDLQEPTFSEDDFSFETEPVSENHISPKEQMKQFIINNTENIPYEFFISGNEIVAKEFLHRMRVELTRFRNKLRERGQVPKKFKVITESIVEQNDGTCKIIIMRTQKVPEKLDADLDMVLNELALDGEL